MRILILTNYANGLYLFRRELLLALQKDGHQVLVSLPPDENSHKIRELGCQVIDTPFERRGNNPVKDLRLFFQYLSLLKKEKPEFVFTYTIKPNLYGGLACRISRIPYICNITGLGTAIENDGILSKVLIRFYGIAVKSARRVFFQNDSNRKYMNARKVACHNYGSLPGSGVNLTEHPFMEYPSEKEGITFLAVVRVMKDKGIAEYLAAAEKIKEMHPETKFVLAGEYEEETREIYEPQIVELEKRGVISYLGHIDNVRDVMAKSHVIIHPSYHEGLSNVLLEAAACGRPVLASDIHGCRETFEEGVSGIGFPIKDAQAIVHAIEKILSFSIEQRIEMGIAGRKWVEAKFDRNLVIKAYREEIAKIK